MDNYERQLVESALKLLHQLVGYADYKEDFKPILKIFPGNNEKTPQGEPSGVQNEENPVGDNGIEQKRGVIEFTEKEILSMPKEKRNYFKINGLRAHWRKKPNGVFEIRCMIEGKIYYGSSRDLKTAKEKFIKDLQRVEPKETKEQAIKEIPTVEEYAYHYLETFKKKYICETGYENYRGTVRRHIAPYFVGKNITEITSSICQKVLNVLDDAGKHRTLEDVNNLLKWICASAVGDGYLKSSPMATVVALKHRRTTGKCIPAELLKEKILTVPISKYDYLILFSTYTGIRPCEMKQVEIEGNEFAIIQNGKKRKTELPTYRRIPIHSALLPYISEIKSLLRVTNVEEVAKHFRKKGLKEYQFKDLRHTFTTFIQECGANEKWVDYATNHVGAQNVTQRVYTHWSDEYQREQMEKLIY